MRYKKNRREPDGLESKVERLTPRHDQHGQYIAYCNFKYHRGLILSEYVCKERECSHYLKLYLKNGNT